MEKICKKCGKMFEPSNYKIKKGISDFCSIKCRGTENYNYKFVGNNPSFIKGYNSHTLYSTYKNMKNRCYNNNSPSYDDYGGRGIKVCDRWLETDGKGFINFLSDMGERPIDIEISERKDKTIYMTLDRINNDGNYEPLNCRWATTKQQSHNQRKYRKKYKKRTTSYSEETRMKMSISQSKRLIREGCYGEMQVEIIEKYIKDYENKYLGK